MTDSLEQTPPPAPATKPRRHWLWRLLRGTLWTLLGLFLLIAALLGWVIGTQSGTRFALETADRLLAPLAVDYQSGSLWRGLQLGHVSWGDSADENAFALAISQLDTRWDFTCLPEKLCITRIAAAQIDVQLPPADPNAPPEPPREGPLELPQLSLPVGLELGELSLPKVTLTTAGQQQEISDIRIALSAADQQLLLHELAARYADNTASAAGTLGLSGDFPLDLQLTARAESILPAPQQVELQLGGSLARTELAAQLSGAFALALNGSLQPLEPTLPLDLRAEWDALRWPPKSDNGEPAQVETDAGTLSAKGDLNGIDTLLATRVTAAGQPPVGVQLDARASTEKADIRALDLDLLGGSLTLRGAASYADAVRWDLRGEFAELDPGQLAPAAPGKLGGELAVRGGLADDGDWYLDAAQLGVNGQLTELPLALQIDARRAAGQPVLLDALRLDALDGQLNLRGQVALAPQLGWDINGDFRDINPGVLAPDAPGKLGGKLAVRGGFGDDWWLELAQLDVGGILRELPLQLAVLAKRPAGEAVAVEKIQLDALEGQLNLRGDVALTPQLGWDISGDFRDINPAPLAPGVPGKLGGKLAVRGGFGDDWWLELAQLDVGGILRELPLQLAVRAQRPAGEAVAVEKIQLDALDGQLNLRGQVALAPQLGWDIDGDFRDINPAPLAPDLPGQLGGDFAVRGGLVESGDWSLAEARAQVDGQLRDYPLKLDALLARLPGDIWQLDKLQLDSGENRIAASGRLDGEWALDGELALPALDELLPEFSGELQATFALTGPRMQPSVQLDARGESITAAEAGLESLSLTAKIDRLFAGDSRVALRADGLRQGMQQFGDLALDLSGRREDHRLTLDLDGGRMKERELALSLAAGGALVLVEGASATGEKTLVGVDWRGALESLRLAAVGQNWQLAERLPLGWAHERQSLRVAAHCWTQTDSEATLCLQQSAEFGASGDANLHLEKLPLASLGALLPPNAELTGALGADIAASWSAGGKPEVNLLLAVDGGGVLLREPPESGGGLLRSGAPRAESEPLEFIYRELRVIAKADPERIDANIALNSDTLGAARVVVNIDPTRSGYPLDGTVRVRELDVEVVRAFLPQLDELAGLVEVDGQLSGTLGQPDFRGGLALTGLRASGELLPLTISDGRLQAQLDGPSATFDGRIETNGGGLDLGGAADWSELKDWRVDATLKGDRLRIEHRPEVIADVSPDLTISAQPKLVSLSGRVEIPYARVKIRELPESAIEVSDDAIIIRDEPEPQPEPKMQTETNLLIVLGNDVRLEGFDLRAEMQGDIGVKQISGQPPLLDGEIEITSGIYKAYGQDLRIRRGRILLLGPVQATAADVEAIRTSGEQVAGLRISGNINRPDVELFAEPSQTQEDTLSYILLGRPLYGAESGGTDEAGLLANAAVALGIAGGRGIATGIAEAFGIQDFEIDTASEGDDTQVVLSGRLSPDLYLRYGVGVLTPVNTITLRYNLTRQFYVETSQGLESALDFFYSFGF